MLNRLASYALAYVAHNPSVVRPAVVAGAGVVLNLLVNAGVLGADAAAGYMEWVNTALAVAAVLWVRAGVSPAEVSDERADS